MDDLKNIIEALLFVADEPLSVERLRQVIGPVEGAEIHAALSQLRNEIEGRRGGFALVEVAGGFQFRTRPEYGPWVKRLLDPRPVRLSKAALETLAIIAYKQPIIRAEIEHLRGVDCGGVLRQLLERKLIRVLGRKEIPGRPLIYATTKRFLEVFDLKDLNDLPTPREIEELGRPSLEERGNIVVEPEEDEGEGASAPAGPPSALEPAEAAEEAAEPPPAQPPGEDAPSPPPSGG